MTIYWRLGMTTAIKKIGDKWEYDGIIFDKKSDAEKVKKSTEAGSKTALDESDFEGGKQRISMWVDEAIVKEFKILAHKRGSKYQTLMNEVLKEYVGARERRLIDLKESEFKEYIKQLVR